MSATTFTVERPGYTRPWYVIVQYDHGQADWFWGVYHSDRTTRPVTDGRAPTQEEASQAARTAAETL
jgi:hypothetical protein